MHLKARQPFAAIAAVTLALAATGFAAAGSSPFQSQGRPSVSPPPCKTGHDHGRCDPNAKPNAGNAGQAKRK
jgi:uncharacterized low-complexity protein